MFDVLCVTDRRLCREDFLSRIEKIARAKPSALILREKDLKKEEYLSLARETMGICARYGTPVILHNFFEEADFLGAEAVQLPLPVLEEQFASVRRTFRVLGASCHSVAEALQCEALGCDYIVAGHIFDTDCKKGLPGRGLEFLRGVCERVKLPVFAIGGITAENVGAVKAAGARGVCVMSGAMICENVQEYINKLRNI